MPFLGPPSLAPVVHESTENPPAPPADVVADTVVVVAVVVVVPGDNDGLESVAADVADVGGGRTYSRRCHRRPQHRSPRHHRYLAVIHPRLRIHKAAFFYPEPDFGTVAWQSGCNMRTNRTLTRSCPRVRGTRRMRVWTSLTVPSLNDSFGQESFCGDKERFDNRDRRLRADQFWAWEFDRFYDGMRFSLEIDDFAWENTDHSRVSRSICVEEQLSVLSLEIDDFALKTITLEPGNWWLCVEEERSLSSFEIDDFALKNTDHSRVSKLIILRGRVPISTLESQNRRLCIEECQWLSSFETEDLV